MNLLAAELGRLLIGRFRHRQLERRRVGTPTDLASSSLEVSTRHTQYMKRRVRSNRTPQERVYERAPDVVQIEVGSTLVDSKQMTCDAALFTWLRIAEARGQQCLEFFLGVPMGPTIPLNLGSTFAPDRLPLKGADSGSKNRVISGPGAPLSQSMRLPKLS